MFRFAKLYASVCDNNVPSLVASLFSWQCLAASTSYFLHAAMNPRPTSAAVSTHTSASNAVALQSSAMPNAWISLCTQLVHFLLPNASSPHCKHGLLWQSPAARSDKRLHPQKSPRAQRCLHALTSDYVKGTVVRGHPMVWILALCLYLVAPPPSPKPPFS